MKEYTVISCYPFDPISLLPWKSDIYHTYTSVVHFKTSLPKPLLCRQYPCTDNKSSGFLRYFRYYAWIRREKTHQNKVKNILFIISFGLIHIGKLPVISAANFSICLHHIDFHSNSFSCPNSIKVYRWIYSLALILRKYRWFQNNFNNFFMTYFHNAKWCIRNDYRWSVAIKKGWKRISQFERLIL